MARKAIDWAGKVVGDIVVGARAGSNKAGLATWHATCLRATPLGVCNTQFVTSSECLRKGYRSCGCLIAEHNAKQTLARLNKLKV